MQHDILNSKLKPFFNAQIARQERETAREKMTRSRNKWRLAAVIFMCLFALESCLPEPTQPTQNSMENAQ